MIRLLELTGGFVLLLATACAGAEDEAPGVARDRAIVANNMEAAQAGDAEAQYRVGDALCCSLDKGGGFHDTTEAVAWLCRAAAQNHGPAAFKLGTIYAGDRAGRAAAYAWLRRAEILDVGNARQASGALWRDLTPAERDNAEAMVLGRTPLPCTRQEVVGRS